MYPTLELLGGAWNKTRSLQLESESKHLNRKQPCTAQLQRSVMHEPTQGW
jgi:hypothetical protein